MEWERDHVVDDNTFVAAKLAASATDVLFGRSTAGAGAGEEVVCTAAGRAILDDADAAAQRTTLGAAAAAHTHALADINDEGALAALNTVGTAQIDNDAVTYAKIQNVSATDRILGRSSVGAGDVEEIVCTAAGRALIDDANAAAQRTTLGLAAVAASGAHGDLSGIGTNTHDQIDTHLASTSNPHSTTAAQVGLGNVTNDAQTKAAIVPNTVPSAGQILVGNAGGTAYAPVSVGTDATLSATGALTIANDAVTYAKMQDVSATSRFLGRITAAAGDIEELTGTQATTLLDVFTSALKGLVPASGGGTTTFLRADGTFAAPTAAAADPSYSPGSFTVATETGRMFIARMKLTGTQRATVQGTGRLKLAN